MKKTYNLSISEKHELALFTSDQEEIRELFDNFKNKKKHRNILYALATNPHLPIDIIQHFAKSEYNLAAKMLSYNPSVPDDIQIFIIERFPYDAVLNRPCYTWRIYYPEIFHSPVLKKKTCEYIINAKNNLHYCKMQALGDIDEEFVLSKRDSKNFHDYVYNASISIETKKKIIDLLSVREINYLFSIYETDPPKRCFESDIIENQFIKNKVFPKELIVYVLDKNIGPNFRQSLINILAMMEGLEEFI